MSVFTVVTRSGKTKWKDIKMSAMATALSHLPWKGHLCKTALSKRRNGLWITHFSFTISLHKEHLSFLRWKRALGRGKRACVYWPLVMLASNQIFLLLLQYINSPSPFSELSFFLAFKRASDISSACCASQQSVRQWNIEYRTTTQTIHNKTQSGKWTHVHTALKAEPNNCKTWLK